jgi:hypothetical protein
VTEHEAANVVAKLLAGHEVDHGALPGEEPAERGLVGCAWKLPKVRVTPGSPSELTVSRLWSP